MSSVVMDNVVVGAGAVVAAGAVVLDGTQIPPGMLYAGVPAKQRGEVRPDLVDQLSATADRYVEYADWFRGSEV
jgi:carbonic anhydrase/acetyltransferase-like protein (isoleucine patch superfamily)